MLLGDVVGLDIDVDDPDAAAAIEEAAREILGLGDVAEIPAPNRPPPARAAAAAHELAVPEDHQRAIQDALDRDR